MPNTLIQITTTQFNAESEETEKIELMTEGTYNFKNDHLYLVYKESELSGMEGTTTTLKLKEGNVSLKRQGTQNVDMMFSQGERFKTLYHTPYGDIPMEILTRTVRLDIRQDPFEANVTIDYDISVKGLFEGKNKMTIVAKKN